MFNGLMQFLNQTYNCGMNYGNRNASSTYTVSDLGRGYCGAVVVSMGLAMYTRTVFASQLKKLKGPTAVFANAAINLFAA